MKFRLASIIAGIVLLLSLTAPAMAAQALTSPVEVMPMFGGSMFYLGTVDYNTDDVNDISGEVGFEGYSTLGFQFTGAATLSFYYNFLTWDYAPYDDPGLFIEVLDSVGGYAGGIDYAASDIDDPTVYGLESTGWLQYTLAGLNPLETYNIMVGAGNTGDGEVQSFAFLDWNDANDDAFASFMLNPVEYAQTGFTNYFYSENDYNTVPVPAAAWLLGSGLLGLLGLRRKFMR